MLNIPVDPLAPSRSTSTSPSTAQSSAAPPTAAAPSVLPEGPPIPPYLLDYITDSPLPVAVYSHADLLASTGPDSLPLPYFQSPQLESWLYQGAGGQALLAQQQLRLNRGAKVDREKERVRENAIRAARAVAPKDLTSALEPGSREPLRKWLVEGIFHAQQRIAESSASSPEPSQSGAATPSTISPHPLPPAAPTASSPSFPFSSSTSSSSSRPSAGRTPSIASSRGTYGSLYSSSTSAHRQISLQFRSTINFARTHWRAQVVPDKGFTLLTMLPAASIANGGQVTMSSSEDSHGSGSRASGSLSGTTLGGGSSVGGLERADSGRSVSSFSEALRSLALAENAGRKRGLSSGILEGVTEETASQQGAEADTEAPESAATSVLEDEPVEELGDVEVTVEAALDATSLGGLAYTLWHAPVGLFRVNTDLSIVQANPMWRQTCGLQPGETNDAWGARISPDDRERVLNHYRQIAEELPMRVDECSFRWLPEEEGDVWCTCTINPVVINGKMAGYTGMLENINKHKAVELAAEMRERHLRNDLAALSDTASVGLVRISLDGKFLQANKSWREIVKLPPDEPDLNQWVKNFHPDDEAWVMAKWKKCLETLEPLQVQYRWYNGDVCLVQAKPNHPDPEEVTGWIASVTDVTAQAKAEEAMLNLSKEREARAKHEAAEAEERRKIAVEEKRQQELLIDVTSHEIRNPISAILQNADFTRSSLQSLRSTLLTLKERSCLPSELDGKLFDDLEEDIEALDSITECGLAQERIANDILGLAQIQLSKYSITPVEFDLATSLRNICRMFKSECRSKGIELKLVIGSSLARLGPRARVFADPARLTQVLVNLLSNAIRFTSKSAVREVTLAVEVSARPPDRDTPLIPPHETELRIDEQKPVYLFFSVEDTGPGMTEEETGRLFAKFMQASPFTHTTWGGSGLGLWIARNLCELQAGRIEVASTVGKGSIFRCFITARSVDAGHAQHASVAVIEGITAPNAERGAAPTVYLAKPGEPSKPLKGLTILCCEDNQINRTVLKRQLTKEGCEDILLACDGQEGLDLLNSRPAGVINCILMDIEMPVMDGLTATRAIRQAEKDGKRPGHQRIVGLTGNARSAQKEMALSAGMNTVVTKPYKVPDLIEKIMNVGVPNEEGPSLTLQASAPGVATTATMISGSPSNEQSFSLGNGGTVELITTGSPTSSSSSKLTSESAHGSPPRMSHAREYSFDSTSATPLADDHEKRQQILEQHAMAAAHSMEQHGAGQVLPPSQSPERSLKKE
ncbi:hypothetical protein JCM8547_008558 [Rhodosporidiobolus lusitaniae]